MILSKRKIVGQRLEKLIPDTMCIEEARICPDRGLLGIVYPKTLEPQVKIRRSMLCSSLD